MNNKTKTQLAIYKVRWIFPTIHPPGMLFLKIVERAIIDAFTLAPDDPDRETAVDFLKSDMWCAEMVGVDSDYIRRIIKQVGLVL